MNIYWLFQFLNLELRFFLKLNLTSDDIFKKGKKIFGNFFSEDPGSEKVSRCLCI